MRQSNQFQYGLLFSGFMAAVVLVTAGALAACRGGASGDPTQAKATRIGAR